MKRFFKWIIKLWVSLVNKPLEAGFKELENSIALTGQIYRKPDKVREDRLKRFKENLPKKQYPIITDYTYSRSYTRYNEMKLKKQEQQLLVSQGKTVNDNGDIVEAQQPYRKDTYNSLAEYNRYAKLFNYNNR